MNKLLKKAIVTSAGLLMLASVGTGMKSFPVHAARMSNFEEGSTKTVRLTHSLRAVNVHLGEFDYQNREYGHTTFHRGDHLKVTLQETNGFGFNVKDHRHPGRGNVEYSMPLKDAKYFSIIKHKHYSHKHARKHIRKHHTRKHSKRQHRRHYHRY